MSTFRSKIALLAQCGALLVATNVLAQRNLAVAPASPSEQRVALVIGNSSYNEAPLKNPVNDATDMAETLRALGFVVTLHTNASTKDMRAAIREFAQNLKRGGVGLFYFAGHGVQSRSGKNYLIPVSADLKEEFELEDEAVDANRVLAGMEEAGNRVNIVILDACRSNPFAGSWRSAVNGLAQMNAPAGSFIGFATAPGSIAADGSGRNGIYTKHLLQNLREGDSNIDRVFTRVAAAVAKETGNKQVPWKSSSLTGDFYFQPLHGGTQVAPSTPAPAFDSATLEVALWDSVKDSKSAEELKAYLDQYPSGRFAAVAKVRLRTLESPAKPFSPVGSWRGLLKSKVTRAAANADMQVSSNGFFSYRSAYGSELVGTWRQTGNILTGIGTMKMAEEYRGQRLMPFPDGTREATITFTGQFSSETKIQGTFSGGGDSGTFEFSKQE